jgi:nucleotide-binding universal stress UspA family protein
MLPSGFTMSSEGGIGKVFMFGYICNKPTEVMTLPECMKLHLNKLLIAVDFSKCSEKALRFAAEWSAIYGSKISVLHVMNDALPLGDILNKGQAEELRNTMEHNVRVFIKDIFDETEDVEILIEKGKVYERITETAKAIKADVILMGANGSAEKNSNYVGSNTMRTMRTCNTPVIVISQQTRILAIESVIFPVDLSKDYLPKLRWGNSFDQINQKIRVHLLSVLKDHDEFLVNRMAQQLTNAKEEFENRNIPHTAEMIKCTGANDSISQVITDYAEKLESSMIFILTQPESSFTPFYVSSMLQEIIALSHVPVMAVNPVPVDRKEKIKI